MFMNWTRFQSKVEIMLTDRKKNQINQIHISPYTIRIKNINVEKTVMKWNFKLFDVISDSKCTYPSYFK